MGRRETGGMRVGDLMVPVRMGRRETGGMRVGDLMVPVRMGRREMGGMRVGNLKVRVEGLGKRMVGLGIMILLHLIFGSQELQILLRLRLGSFHVLDSLLHRLFLPQVILGCVTCMCGCVGMRGG